MRIALIGNTLFHQGAEYVLAALARGFAARGHSVDVILSKRQHDLERLHPDWKRFEVRPGIRVIVTGSRRGRYSVFPFRRLIKENGYDVVMSHASPFSIPLVLATIGMKKKPLLIHVQHSGGTGVNGEGVLLSPRATLKSRIGNGLYSKFDAQFAVSSGTGEGIHRMSGYPREKIYTVYNPVVDELFRQKLAASPRHPWLASPDLPVIVAAGVFVANKGYSMLIRAFDEVLKLRPARLVIFGRGGCQKEYEREIERLGIGDSVSLPGQTDNLPAELKNAACFVVSSVVESFSVVCVEALAAGTPVVSTNCPYGPPEILKGGQYGILVENKNQHALAEGILKVLNGGGVKPTPEMVAPYTVEATVERYEKAIAKVMSR